jgi:YD repeat-containing protein
LNPLGYRTTFSFDVAGRQVAVTDANGKISTTVFDAAWRVEASVNALGFRTTTVFDIASQVGAIQDARGNRWSFTYDEAGRRTEQIDPLGRLTTSSFDAAGGQTLRIDARGNRTTYSFDAVGRLTRRLYPDDSRSSFTFDAVGNRTKMEDVTGVYTFTYDSLNRHASTEQSGIGATTYAYDLVGQSALQHLSGKRSVWLERRLRMILIGRTRHIVR